jgi:transposase InsO family protein
MEEEVRSGSKMTVAKMARLAQVNRSSFYRFDPSWAPVDDSDMDLRDAIQRIALEFPSYGRPRITAELRRRGWKVNPKRVYRILVEDNLLCLRHRKFVVTTDSGHRLPIYPNLVPDLKITDINQLWVADITYVRLQEEFVYLAVILDAYSRRVIGWALDRTLEERLTVMALNMALMQRQFQPGLVHHSDRGVQYASKQYTQLLLDHGIRISMSRKGNPWDNAICESFLKSLKYEEVYRNEYRNLEEAYNGIRGFIQRVYNRQRLHSALGYLPPVEFERACRRRAKSSGVEGRPSI